MDTPSDTLDYPTLSLAERDRRWAWTRAFMAERELDGLIVFGLKGRERYDGYLSNEWADGVVVFPMTGEPVHFTWTATRILRRTEQLKNETPWIDDMRVGLYGPSLVAVLAEMGLDCRRIGVVGLDGRGPAEVEGIVSYNTWKSVLDGLPEASFVDVSVAYSGLMLVKSDEEIALFRHAAQVGELACQAMLEASEPGASEHEIYAQIMWVIHANGCFSVAPHLNMTIGIHDLGWGHPMWTYRGGRPRLVQKGHLIQAEIFPCYGGVETQQQMAIAVGEVPHLIHELADVARRSHGAGLEILRPGIPFGEVIDAMEAPLAEADCWHLTPLIHSLGPISRSSATGLGIEQLPGIEAYKGIGPRPPTGADMLIEPGMLFAFEPNACKTNHRVNIGGTVLVTPGGCELLNKMPVEMRTVG